MPISPDAAATIAAFAPRLRAVAFDVDGTLTDAHHRVSDANLAALRRLDEAGIPVIVVTGRALRAAATTLENAGLHGYVVALNGAVIESLPSGEIVHEQRLGADTARAVIAFARARGVVCSVFTPDRIVMNDPAADRTQQRLIADSNPSVECVIGDLDAIDGDEVFKVMLADTPENLAVLLPELREVAPQAALSLPVLAEVCHPDASKGRALAVVLQRLGIDPADVAGAGDGGNDVSWLGTIGLGAAMANAAPELKAVAAVEIGHQLDDGAAEFVDALLAARP